ncbi:phage tail length tape measure family protein [Sinorhizobium meliloti]|uniref:phage tail length tape measure family protein n=1 Tax=Rhizobium meliloti TaxID=382 RepID=UPI000FDB735E|nr:phage tail length tape measure family protein [Sinorhizobium meliloti]RVM10876.1 hypothetical protein CN142_17125 [Sinorhizobium meliloti]
MTVALRSLRVTADFDAGKYVAGMNDKVAADKAGAASSVQVGAALARTDVQAGQSGGVLTKLSRQYVDGYGNAARFEAAVAALGRGMEKGAVPMERVDVILEGIYRKYGLTANAADLMANNQVQLAGAVDNLNARLAAEASALDAAAAAQMRYGRAANDNTHQRRQLVFQVNDTVQSLALGMPVLQVLLQQGPQIAQIYGPDEGGIGRAFSDTGKMITGTIAKFPLLSAAAFTVGAAFAAMTYEINQTTDATVSFGDVALASVQVLGNYLHDWLKPAVEAVGPWFQSAWDAAVAGVKYAGNTIINSFRAAFEDLKFLWGQFPNMIGAAVVGAVNAVIGGVQLMVQKAADHLDKWIEGVNTVLGAIPGGDFTIDKIGKLDFKEYRVPNPYAEKLGQATGDRNARISDIMNDDPLGGFFDDVRDQAIRNAREREKSKGGRGARERESDYERTIRQVKERTVATEEEAKVIGLSTFAMERQSAVQDILTAAQRDGLAIGKAFANAQELINASASSLSPELAKERERILGVATAYANAEAAAEKAEESRRRFEENMQFARDTTRGFIDDFSSAIEDGASVWEAFADAALNALSRIVDKLLDDVLDAIFEVNQAGTGSGGVLGGIGSWFGGLFGGGSSDPWAGLRMANGGVFSAGRVSAFAKGGAFTNQIVDRPTLFPFAKGAGLMGEAGPEAIMPLRRDASGRLGVSAAIGGGSAAANDNQSTGGRTVIEVILSPDLVAQIFQQTDERSVRLIQQSERNRHDLYLAGDDAA